MNSRHDFCKRARAYRISAVAECEAAQLSELILESLQLMETRHVYSINQVKLEIIIVTRHYDDEEKQDCVSLRQS